MRDGRCKLGLESAQILVLLTLINPTMQLCFNCDTQLPQNYSQIAEFESNRTQNRNDTTTNQNRKTYIRISEALNGLQYQPLSSIKGVQNQHRNELQSSSQGIGAQNDSLELDTAPTIYHRSFEDFNQPWRARARWKQVSTHPDKSPPINLNTAESQQPELSSDCALILKRTYILKDKTNDEWGDKFVFNDIDPDDKKPEIHRSNLCIKHSDVDKAIEEAKHMMKFTKPGDIDSFEASEKSIASVAELSLSTGQILAKKFDLSHDEILNALPMIDMSSSKFFWKDLCPKNVRPMICSKSRYRTITAHCNNLKHPSWGASNTPYSRYLPPDYADGLDLPRASRDGHPLPSARLISSIVHRDADEPSNDYSSLFASWGQLLDHDMTRAALGNGKQSDVLVDYIYIYMYVITLKY